MKIKTVTDTFLEIRITYITDWRIILQKKYNQIKRKLLPDNQFIPVKSTGFIKNILDY